MPSLRAESYDAEALQEQLHRHGYNHLEVRCRGAVLTIESGPPDDRFPHARVRRDTVHLWLLEMPNRRGRWDRTPFRATLDELVQLLITDFQWMLADVWNNSDGTSDPVH